MSELKEKLEELISQLQELKKSQSERPKKQKKLPPVPPPIASEEDHPPKLSEKEAMRLVKEDKEECTEVLKTLPNGQWVLEKNYARKLSADKEVKPDWTKTGHKSVFDMDHVNAVMGMKSHDEAKKYAHSIVDSSSAKDETKRKIKGVIDNSKSVSHLGQAMANHILSHQGLNVIGVKKK